ncbi:hypothetical protein MMC29_001271 [Sticta canariensis]|nr:hypothetical protein [Sticta canariensis]
MFRSRSKKEKITTPEGCRVAESNNSSNDDFQKLRISQPETSRRDILESQNLELATNQGQRRSQTHQGHSSDVVATEDEKQSKNLWMLAFEALKLRDPELVTAYECHLASADPSHTVSAFTSPSPELIKAIIKERLEHREANRLVVHLGTRPIKVREQGEKIIKFILWSNSFISAAVSVQPYAALAWSGVSILLPLLLNSSQQSRVMLEGLTSVSDILRLYRIKETLYLQDSNKSACLDFLKAIEELYTDIFEYQARLICYLSWNSAKRGFRGMLKLDDWKEMLEKIKASDDRCTQYSTMFSKEEEHQFYAKESSYIEQSLDFQKQVFDMFEASRALAQRERRDDKEAELLQSLASDYKSDKDSISTRVPGTCEWFFKDQRFLDWRDSKTSRLLWVSAGPGCGKSVLSRSLIDERRVCTNALTSTVCYFFFKDGQEQRTRGSNALSAILHQLFGNTTVISHALSSYKSYGDKLRDSFSELWGLLVECARNPETGDIICVLDALDECKKEARNQLMQKLVGFFSQKDSDKKPSFALKFLVTSRPYDDLEQQFQPLSGVSTYLHFDGDDESETIGKEIDLVIDAKIPDIAGDFSDGERKRISDHLKNMNNRTYLWLFLTIDIIMESRSNFRRVSSLDMLLHNLPSEVSDAYEKILARSSDQNLAQILLQLIVAATRPLSLTEVNIALAIATQKERCTSQKALNLWPSETFRSTIQNICGLFVSVHDGKVSLIHQTAREFLTRTTQSDSTHSEKWQGCVEMAMAHSAISKICLVYLDFDDFASLSSDKDNEGYPFLDYAAKNWPVHYRFQHSESAKDLQKTAQRLCSAPQPLWFKIYCSSYYISDDGWTGLELASWLGLIDVAESFLNKRVDVNAQNGEYGKALKAASYEGHEKVVQMLLEKGANVNAQGGKYGNALQGASYGGHEKVGRTLLEKGADVNAQGGRYGNALQAASYRGHEKFLQMLLEKGADVNAQGGFFGDALQAASYGGHQKVVQTLLDKGADVNAQGGKYGNALQVASYRGREQVVQMLLEKEVDVNAQGGLFGNALQGALCRGHENVAHTLLENGADVNAQGGEYGNALQRASYGGLEKVVQTLLEKGADVNAQSGRYGTALQGASYRGHENVAQTLLENGADVNAQGGEYGNALQGASYGGLEKVVQTLLEKGADVNAQGGEYGNALQAASSEGHEKVVQTLLEKGADVNAQGGRYGNALQAASCEGHEKVVQTLLKKEADVNVQGGEYGNALQAASCEGHETVVQTLLEKGADVNAQGGRYGNALQGASYGGHNNVVQILLEKGGNLSRNDMQGRNPLHLACAGGQLKIVERLLNVPCSLTLIDKQGRNCLHHAASNGSIALVTWLLKKGMDPNLADRNRWTSLHWAARSGSVGTVRVLKDAGCKLTIEAIEGWTPHSVAIFHRNESLQSELASELDINPLVTAAESTDNERKVIPGLWHEGYHCDGCFLEIYGPRYKCSKCPDFDFCFKCKVSSSETHGDHEFDKIE